MHSPLICAQHASIFLPMSIDVSSGTPTLGEGSGFATLADTGTGIVTVTFNNPFGRAPIITGSCVTATGDVLIPTFRSVASTGFIVELSTDAGTLTDGIVMLHIWGSRSADQGRSH